MSRLEKLVESRIFRNVVFAVVLLNAVLLGVQCCSKWSENVETRLSLGLDFCLVFFVAETILKLVALRSGYFGNRWNCLDFAIVLISVIAEYSGILSIRMLRLVRSVFTLKIFSGSGNIQRDILDNGFASCFLLHIFHSRGKLFWRSLSRKIRESRQVHAVPFSGDHFGFLAGHQFAYHQAISLRHFLFHSVHSHKLVHIVEYHRRNYCRCDEFRGEIPLKGRLVPEELLRKEIGIERAYRQVSALSDRFLRGMRAKLD